MGDYPAFLSGNVDYIPQRYRKKMSGYREVESVAFF